MSKMGWFGVVSVTQAPIDGAPTSSY